MRRRNVIFITAPATPPLLLAGPAEEYQTAIEQILGGWSGVWLDMNNRLFGDDAGRRLRLWGADDCGSPALVAWLVYEDKQLIGIRVGPSEAELGVIDQARQQYRSIEVLPLEMALGAAPTEGPPMVRMVGTTFAGASRQRSDRPRAELWCPRCEEQLLHQDPVYDDISHRDGRRICNACAIIEALAAERERGDSTGPPDRS